MFTRTVLIWILLWVLTFTTHCSAGVCFGNTPVFSFRSNNHVVSEKDSTIANDKKNTKKKHILIITVVAVTVVASVSYVFLLAPDPHPIPK
jgi:hypothetical protein